MENTPVDFKDEGNEPEELKQDRSLFYMGIILGVIILIMTYMTLFIDDPWKAFRKKENSQIVVENKSGLLNESELMSDEEVRQSLSKFIEAFYYDQRKGYFDPPSYFAPITKTFYNYHNLTYERLKDLYWKRMADMKGMDRNWIVSTLDFVRADSGILATYWVTERYFRPSVNQHQSVDIKYEMVIDENGKIFSLREAEVRNFEQIEGTMDTSILSRPIVSDKPPVVNQVNKDQRAYDISMVDAVPEFPGGQAEMAKFLQTNLRYPLNAKENKIQGKVYVASVVEKDGALRSISVRQGIGGGCDEEAIRLLKSSPHWKPGILNGTPVSTYLIIPVTFQLNQ